MTTTSPSLIGLYKTEVIDRRGPWRHAESRWQVELFFKWIKQNGVLALTADQLVRLVT